jgi:hypothetical protein
MKEAKKDMIHKSREIICETCGWRTLIATDAVGTLGGGSCNNVLAAKLAVVDLAECHLGVPRYDGGNKSCLSVAWYICAIVPVPMGICSNTSNTSSNGFWNTHSMTRFVCEKGWGFPCECIAPSFSQRM